MCNDSRKNDIPYLTRYLFKLIGKDFDKRLEEVGLTGQQGRILFFIVNKYKDNIEIHQNDIELEFSLSKSTVSGIVKRLEKKELITVTKQPPYAILKPSNKGLELVQHLIDSKKENLKRLTDGFDEKEQKQFCEYLLKAINNMEGDD